MVSSECDGNPHMTIASEASSTTFQQFKNALNSQHSNNNRQSCHCWCQIMPIMSVLMDNMSILTPELRKCTQWRIQILQSLSLVVLDNVLLRRTIIFTPVQRLIGNLLHVFNIKVTCFIVLIVVESVHCTTGCMFRWKSDWGLEGY